MNSTYRPESNRAMGVLQVASKLARPNGDECRFDEVCRAKPHRRLAQTCAAALIATVMPAWAGTDLTITATGSSTATCTLGVCTSGNDTSTLTTDDLQTALSGGLVNVNAMVGAGTAGTGSINWTDGSVDAGANSLTLTAGLITFDGTLTNLTDLVFVGGTPTGSGTATGTGSILGIGSATFNLTGNAQGTAGGIQFNGFTAADAATVTGAVGFDDGSKSNQGMVFTAATSVTGTGTISNVAGSFDDGTLTSAATLIVYSPGFTSVSGTGGVLTGVTGLFDLGTDVSAASGMDYSGFGITAVAGSGSSATIGGTGQTYVLSNSVSNAGVDGTVAWTGFSNIDDASGTVDFGTGGNVAGNIDAQTLNYGSYSATVTFDLGNGSGATTGIGGTWNGVATVAGSGNIDTITGSSQTYALSGINAGNNGTVSWTGFEKIVDSGTGTINTTGGQTYNLSGTNAGTIATVLAGGFTGIGNLSDSTAGNFVFADGAKVTGTVSGGGAGTLDYSAYTSALNVGLGGSATGTGGWSGISTVKGGSASDTISGNNQTYTLSGANVGSNGTVSWTSFENISDNAGTVDFGTSGSVTGNIDAPILNYGSYSATVTLDLSNGAGATTGIGGIWTGVATVAGSGNMDTITGSSQTYTLTGTNAGSNGTVSWSSFENLQDSGNGSLSAANQTWSLTGHNLGSVTGLAGTFSGIGNLVDMGSGRFIMHSGADGDISGDLDAGTNGSLDYTGYTTAVDVNISGTGSTGVGGTTSGISSITASSNLGVSGATAGSLGITTTGAGTTATLGALSVGSDLTLTASGAVLQTGAALTVNGISTIDAGSHAITLASAGNDFAGAMNLTGGATRITDQNALTLGSLATGTLTATSTGALNLGHGTIGGDLVATSNDGAITEASGGLQVTGTSNLQAGAGAITLTDPANHFTGAVSVAGQGVSLRDVGDLTIVALSGGTNGTVNLTAGGALALPASGIDTGMADLNLAANGGALVMPGALSGANVSLAGRDGITLDNNLTSPGTVTLTSSNGGISQNAGVLTAATLTGSSTGDTVLNGANKVDMLGSFTAANFSLGNAQSLAVNGPMNVAGSLSLATTSGALSVNGDLSADVLKLSSATDLTLSHDLSAGTLSLTAGGAIDQGAGVLTTGTLNSSSTGDTTLAGANQIDKLGNLSAANLSLTNTQALTIVGTLSVANAGLTDNAGITVVGAINASNSSTIAPGTALQIGNGGTTGSISGNVLDNGSLAFDRSNDLTFAGVISGSGTLIQQGSGVLALDGDNSGFSGSTRVASGRLIVGSATGSSAMLNGDVEVDSGASLGGHGSIGGNVLLNSGSHLAPDNAIGTLNVAGDLKAAQGSVLDYEFGVPGAVPGAFGESDRTVVDGNLTLNGAVLNVTDIGGFNTGTYNLFTYGGTLSESNGGISLGTTPGGNYIIQMLTGSKQVNLINATGLTLNFWNANGLASSTTSGGGDGTWSTTAPVWTDASGSVTLTMPQPGFAIFGGTPGTVTVDNTGAAVSANGLQFATDGYKLGGDTLTLVSPNNGNMPIIRVGDGSSAGANSSATISATIAGTEGLNKTDLGTLILTGANTYTGGTTISGGTLQGNTTSLHGNITDNAMLAFDQATDGTFAGVVSGNGALTKLGTGTLTLTGANSYSGGTTISAGTLRGNAASLQGNINDQAALVIDQASDGVFAGSVSGQGTITKLGGGTLTVNTVNTFSGSTTVQAGKLVVGDDSHASATLGGLVTVSSGATLGGIGTLGALDLAGTVALSHSFGTLHVTGDVTFRPGSSYQIEATPDGHANAIVANGKVSILGGSALVLAQNGDWAPRTDYTILTGAQGISGQFATASSSLTFLHPVLSYSANAINLSLQRNAMSFASVARTSNQRATAAAADQLSFANPAYSALTTVDVATARHAFDQLSGVIHASTSSALIDDSRHVRDTINRHLLGIRNDETECRTTGDGSVWTSAWGHGGHHDGDGNAALMQSNGSGLLVGADLDFGSEGRVGAVIGHGQSSIQSASVGSSAHVLGDQAGLYASGTFDAFVLRGGAVYAWQNVTTHRTVAFGSFADQLRGKHHARTAQAYVEGGYRFDLGHAQQLEPFVNLARIHVRQDGVREGGGGAALVVTGNSASMSTATLGLRDTFALDTASTVHGHASLGWQQSWGDLTPVSSMHFASGNSRFAISGVPVARHAVATDLGVDFKLAKNVSVDASYLGQFGSGVKDQGARTSLTVTF